MLESAKEIVGKITHFSRRSKSPVHLSVEGGALHAQMDGTFAPPGKMGNLAHVGSVEK